MKRYLRMPLVPDPTLSSPNYPVYVAKYKSILVNLAVCQCPIGAIEIPARGMLKKMPWITVMVDDACPACATKVKDLLSRLDVTERFL